jgi:hypothetical protein
VAGDVVGQMGEQLAKGGAADRPTVDEQHIGPAAHTSVRDFAGADIEESIRLVPEQVGSELRGDAHVAPAFCVVVVITAKP